MKVSYHNGSPTKGFTIQLHQLVLSLSWGLAILKLFWPKIWILKPSAALCFIKSRVNSGYLWIRLHVRACLAIFTKCWRPHSVSWSRPEKQHPQKKKKKIKSQISSVTSNTKSLKHAVTSAERSEFVFADSSFFHRISSVITSNYKC